MKVLAQQQHVQLRSFLRAAGDLPAPSEPEPVRLAGDHELPPSTPWVHSSPSRLPAAPPEKPLSPPRMVTSPQLQARVPALAARPMAHSLDMSLNSAQTAELARALAEAHHAELERQRLHRLSEMHASSTDAAVAKSARLEAALAAAHAMETQRARREAELDAALIAARARIAELEALDGERRLAFEQSLEGSTHDSLQRARAARAHEDELRRELEAAKRDAAELRARDDAHRAQAAEWQGQVAVLRQQVAEARAEADEDNERARALQKRLNAMEPELREAHARAKAALAEAERVPALQRALDEARASGGVQGGSGNGSRSGKAGRAAGGGGGGSAGTNPLGSAGDEDGGAAAADAELARQLSAAQRQVAALQAELGKALAREEGLHAQHAQLLAMQRDLEAELHAANAHAARVERSARELRAAAAAESAADGRASAFDRAPRPGAAAAAAEPAVSSAHPGGGGGGTRQAQRPNGPQPVPAKRESASASDQASTVFGLSSGEAQSRPSIRTNLAPPSRVPYALAAEGAPGGGSATRAQLEARHMELSLERDRLQAEYARMPITSGRTLGERRQKALVEQRLEDLAAELGALNVRLRPL